MVLEEPVAVPAGAFEMGDDASSDAAPRRAVTLSAYRVDRTEVSIARFEAFTAAGGYTDSAWWSEAGAAWLAEHAGGLGAAARAQGRPANHPVVGVSYWEAEAACRFFGGQLPTEAQWERAACGNGPYPWGEGEAGGVAWFTLGKEHHLEGVNTMPVTDTLARLLSPAGLAHAAGNVMEWTLDSYRRGYDGLAAEDPLSTRPSAWRAARGGSYMDLPSYATCTHREPVSPDEPRLTLGFRCAYAP